MTICWNGRWRAVTSEKRGAALAHVLRAATIAAIASSCSTTKGQSDADTGYAAAPPASLEENPPPELKELPKEIEGVLAANGYHDVQFVTIAYSENGQEKLIALKPGDSEYNDPDIDEDEFLIPPVGSNFDDAVVIFTGSPARLTRCGRRSGGTRYCDFN